MNIESTSVRSGTEPSAPLRSVHRLALRSVAWASLLSLGVLACGDDGTEPGYTTPDGGQPISYTGGTAGGLANPGLAGPAPGLAVGQVYELDSGISVGSFGGTNGNGVSFGSNPALTGGAGFTGGGFGVNPGGGGAAGLIGGLTGGGGGASGLIGGLGGFTGGAGGGAAVPVTPLDPSVKKPDPSKLPQVSGACPDMRDGSTATVAGIQMKFWAGASGAKGPLVFYWHGTGGSADEAVGSLTGNGLGPVLNDIKAQGGIVASAENSTGQGNSVDTVVWTTDDFKAADQVVACAVQAGRIDPGRIHALGFSAGGLMAGAMYYLRSNYLASVVTYSGGTSPWPGNSMVQDPSNKLPIMLFHGGDGDWVVLGFKDQSIELATDAKSKGRFAIVCDHGGGHGIPSAGPSAAWAFFKAHPYNTTPEPWTSLPSPVPSYCKIF